MPFKGKKKFNTVQDLHLEVVPHLLHRRCQTLCVTEPEDVQHQYANELQKVVHEFKFISGTLSVGLLNHIKNTFGSAYCEHQGIPVTGRLRESYIDYDRQLDTLSRIQEIEILQVKLDAVRNEEEQQALEEDITGRILWLCWCGICVEVNQLLPKAVDYIQREGIVEIMARTGHVDPNDDQAHLLRIMFDARAGISKHELVLAAHAADQAKWLGTARVATTTNNQGTTPSASSQNISTSIV
ncbi:hypothetical protein F5141DRAFT_1212142 [Pisolithus sp. B1]|nr:hypothetical protein F5141DRAFT_1212142 [Pisolithus sp. B1]